MPFYIAWANADHTRNVASELLLSPGPGAVEYPAELRGNVQETPGGVVILQVSVRDPRRRAWLWRNYPEFQLGYQRVWRALEPLRSRSRRAAGLSPYVYLRDTVTHCLARRDTYTGAHAGGPSTTTVLDPAAAYPMNGGTGLLAGASVDFPLSGQRGVVSANTDTTLTLDAALWAAVATGEPYVVTQRADDWVRVRVLDATRKVADEKSSPVYEASRVDFVIDDPRWVEPA